MKDNNTAHSRAWRINALLLGRCGLGDGGGGHQEKSQPSALLRVHAAPLSVVFPVPPPRDE